MLDQSKVSEMNCKLRIRSFSTVSVFVFSLLVFNIVYWPVVISMSQYASDWFQLLVVLWKFLQCIRFMILVPILVCYFLQSYILMFQRLATVLLLFDGSKEPYTCTKILVLNIVSNFILIWKMSWKVFWNIRKLEDSIRSLSKLRSYPKKK